MLPYLRLMRPANILTAIADILLGVAASGYISCAFYPPSVILEEFFQPIVYLVLATSGLYAGGIVFNDIFDHELDAVERPERPIPSGQVSLKEAATWGIILLLTGIYFAAKVNVLAGCLALSVALLALFYNSFAKESVILGPMIMGSCRAANLLMGLSIVPGLIFANMYLAIIPIIYIGAITLISRGEVHGANAYQHRIAGFLYLAVVLIILLLGGRKDFSILIALPFMLFWLYQIIPSWWNAGISLDPEDVMKSVKAGVIGLISLDAAIAAGFAGWYVGLLILSLLPISWLLAKLFAVT